MTNEPTRRDVLTAAAGAAIGGMTQPAAGQEAANREPFIYSLNTSTIRGQNIPIVDEIAIAARAGYQAIEPWINELERYVQGGGNLRDLGRRIQDAGLRVESAIGFAEWIVDDEARRRRGLETARRDMDMIRQIGGTRMAAPPSGATNQTNLNILQATERYRALCELGQEIGVSPQAEIWGHSRSLN